MALLYLANRRVNTVSQLINGIRAVAICLDSATPLATNLDLIKEAIEASTTELMSETTTIISNLAENAIKSISEVEDKCQEFLCKEQEHIGLEDNVEPPQLGHPKLSLGVGVPPDIR
jgi:translation initiation factor 2B subunit (eIF-2B alpha/beta/delta family)